MKFSHLTERISGEGARAWAVHYEATRRRRAGQDVIILSVGDPDFDTPPAIVAEAKASLDRGRTHYSGIVGDPHLRAAIARYHGARAGVAAGPENVVVMAGAQCALFAAALCLLDPEEEVVVPEPMYVTYGAVVGAAILTLLPQALTVFHDYEQVTLGLALMLTMVFMPKGLVPSLAVLLGRAGP